MLRGVASLTDAMGDGSPSEIGSLRIHFQIVVHIEMQHHVRVPLHAVLRVQMPRQIARARKHAVAERTHAGLGLLGLRGLLASLRGVQTPRTHERRDPRELPRVHAHAARVEPQIADVALDEMALREGGLQAVAVQLPVAVLLHAAQQALHDLLAFLLHVVQLPRDALVHLRHQRAQQLLDLPDLRREAAATAREHRARVGQKLRFAHCRVRHPAQTRQLQRAVGVETALVVVQIATNEREGRAAGEAGQRRGGVRRLHGIALLTVRTDRVAEATRRGRRRKRGGGRRGRVALIETQHAKHLDKIIIMGDLGWCGRLGGGARTLELGGRRPIRHELGWLIVVTGRVGRIERRFRITFMDFLKYIGLRKLLKIGAILLNIMRYKRVRKIKNRGGKASLI